MPLDLNEAIIGSQEAVTLIKTVGDLIAMEADRSAEVIVQNETSNTINYWAQVTGQTGGSGSGYWAKGDGPDPEIPKNVEEVAGLESSGAGAVGLLVYSLGNGVLAVMYFAAPLTTGVRTHVKLLYAPSWNNYSQSARQSVANVLFEAMDVNDGMVSQTATGFGFTVTARLTGNDHIEVYFTIEESPNQTVGIRNVSNNQFIQNPWPYASVYNGLKFPFYENELLYTGLGDPMPFVQLGTGTGARFQISGDPTAENLYLNYRDLTGAIKLYGTSVYWTVADAATGVSLESNAYSQYMWLDGNEPYITGEGNPENSNAQWELVTLP